MVSDMLRYFERYFKNKRIILKLSTGETVEGEYVDSDRLGNILLAKAVIKSDDKTVMVGKLVIRGSFIVYVYSEH